MGGSPRSCRDGGFLPPLSWRWIFYINVPFGAVAMVLLATSLRGVPRPARRPEIDYLGLGLFTGGISGLLYGISIGGIRGFDSASAIVPIVLAILALVVFVAVEGRAREPIVPLRLFRNRMWWPLHHRLLSGMASSHFSFVQLFCRA